MAEKDLYFFNKEGDYLNFNYNELTQRWEGDILFHENSNDTFKTYGIYTLENVPSFDYELVGELTTKKFQLFNEHGFHFYSSKSNSVNINFIEPVNNDPNFYSKWLYGENIETTFPIGTLIKFNSPVLEFNNINRTYCVVSSKKGAIMIISQMDNATFESTYFSFYTSSSLYNGVSISGINAVGVYHYINNFYENNLSLWNEPDFYDMVYVGKKLHVIGSDKNNESLTINNIDLTDQRHFEYYVDKNSLPTDTNLIVEIKTKTDVPRLYNGFIDVTSDGKFIIDPQYYPQLLKPGTEFKIVGSTNNTNFFTVAPIPNFDSTTTATFYATGSQVIFNNEIRQCVLAYTQSFSSPSYFVDPRDVNYWGRPTYIKVDQTTVPESLLNAQIYLTTDRYYFQYGWTNSASITLASTAEKYKSDLTVFNLDLFYQNNQLKADLVYASDYAEVNFYHTQVGPTYSIGGKKEVYEKIVGVSDTLVKELNYNYSSNFNVNVVFTDLDGFGIKISINGMIYDVETIFVYSGATIDMERTIDRTLRNWLTIYYVRLYSLGIIAELKFTGSYTSVFYNSIFFRTEYPNVPMIFDYVDVGDTAAFYIEHSRILFQYLGPYLEIIINDDSFYQSTAYGTGSLPDIPTTLSYWYDEYAISLLERGIIVKNINNLLTFDVLSLEQRLDYVVSTGKVNLPGIDDYKITEKLKGSEGVLIASNEVVLPTGSTSSFEASGFSTGMAFSINNTFHPFNNQEYVIDYLEPTTMNLSYQGPFWGLTNAICNSSAFITLAFSLGFGQTACVVPVGPTGGIGGPFDNVSGGDFNPLSFSLAYNPNSYNFNTYNYSGYSANLVDLIYVQLSNSILLFGDDLVAIDSYYGDYLTTIPLPGNTQSIQLEFNTINNYLYCLSKYKLFVVDTVVNTLVSTISLTASNSSAEAFDVEINPVNGDVYITYENLARVDIFAYNNLTSTPTVTLSPSTTNFPPSATRTGAMVYNSFEGDMYITTNANEVIRVNSNRTIQTSYGISGLTHSIFYEPVFESVYVYSTASLWRIDNGVTQSVSLSTYQFNDIIFNNLTGEMNVSNNSGLYRLNLSSATYSQIQATAAYGYLAMNQYDGQLYVSGQGYTGSNGIIASVNALDGTVLWWQNTGAPTTKIIYNPERKSVWAIQPTINSVAEVQVVLNGSIIINPATYSGVEDLSYGTLDPNYVPRESIWLKTREYFRRPRENFEGDVSVKYYWRWVTDQVSEFFLYDFSGEQLSSTGSYAYTGPKPLENPVLSRTPNRDITKVSYPQYQQTIFDRVEYTLSYVDDSDDTSVAPESLELFIGYKAEQEGALRSVLQLYKSENIIFDIESDSFTNVTFTTTDVGGDRRGEIYINQNSPETFTGKGLKPGQHIVIYIKDVTNNRNQYISTNNSILVKVREVYTKYLIVDFFNYNLDLLFTENTVLNDYPTVGQTTYLKCTFKVKDKEIGRFVTYGQTEEEDIRFKIELGNVGKLINPDEVFIFKEYDINEGGIDWTILNRKRKEMLMMKSEIFPFIGSYKSLINAINYFGYNDLQLNEYYRNTDPSSKLFGQLFKVEIPDIFDNTVKGWNEKDFIKYSLPNPNYEGTNLFNLTYFITDFDGNYILNYSLDEIIIKLQGLKYWLKRNIVPLTHTIMDITGRTSLNSSTVISHQTFDVSIFNIKQEMTPIMFKMNEAYLSPVNSGSTVYNCVLDFYSIIPGLTDTYYDDPLIPEPKPYTGAKLVNPDYFDIKIRTYKTYKEWAPFTTYEKGDKVIYFDLLYESQIDNNKVKNPRKFEETSTWSPNDSYVVSSVVEYQRDFYVFSGLGSSASVSPNLDPQNWLKVTEWKRINLEPVQTIQEYREGSNIKPFNFTVDSNIDPFVVIEVTSDNGYGSTYTYKKSYYLKGIKDLVEQYSYIDPIGPFTPITPVY
jgi:hypothetical protein